MKIKHKISEKKLFGIIRSFLKKNIKDDMIHDYIIDYNETFDRIVVNILFDKKVKDIKRGKYIWEVIEKLEDYFGIVPFVYGHYVTATKI